MQNVIGKGREIPAGKQNKISMDHRLFFRFSIRARCRIMILRMQRIGQRLFLRINSLNTLNFYGCNGLTRASHEENKRTNTINTHEIKSHVTRANIRCIRRNPIHTPLLPVEIPVALSVASVEIARASGFYLFGEGKRGERV